MSKAHVEREASKILNQKVSGSSPSSGTQIETMAKYRPEFGHKSQSSAWNGISNWLSFNRIDGDVNLHIEKFLKSKNVEMSKDKSINANRVQNRFNEFKKFMK